MTSLREYTEYWCHALERIYDQREARNILLLACEDVLNWTRSDVLAQQELSLSNEHREELQDVLERLVTGEPYQYIVGFTYFCDLRIDVSPAVLIPRPETEELAAWIRHDLPTDFSGRIEDWCTGSGCIALALKDFYKKAEVLGIDVSKDAVFRAKANAERLHLDVAFEVHSALADIPYEEPLEVLVANPPYIPVHEKEDMRSNVIEYEPELALFVPSDEALLFYNALGEQARQRLVSGGLLYFELHEEYAHETGKAMEALGFIHVEVRNDLQGKPRMLKAVQP